MSEKGSGKEWKWDRGEVEWTCEFSGETSSTECEHEHEQLVQRWEAMRGPVSTRNECAGIVKTVPLGYRRT